MSWPELTKAFNTMYQAEPGSEACEAGWAAFSSIVADSADKPPYHIKLLLDRLDALRAGRPREGIVILDHGCGGALTLFFIAVLGYTNFWGLDVGGDFKSRNALCARKFGHVNNRLQAYGGEAIPLPDASVDFIFSQQVVEHLTDQTLEPYYREEGRVLKQGGMAVHYAPHRLTPYDSHTRTWLIHYLPRPVYHGVAKLLGSPIPSHLHLRWPWVHRALARRNIGSLEDVTTARFNTPPDADNYDGSLALRNLLATAMNAPVAGPVARAVLANLVMLETVSVKP